MRALLWRIGVNLVYIIGGLALIGLLVVSSTIAAPAPRSKPKHPPPILSVVGAWRLTWGDGHGDVVISKDGGFWCLWAGQQWIGKWELTGRHLTVIEGKVSARPDSVPESPIRWEVDLDRSGFAGELCDGPNLTYPYTRTFRLDKHE